MMLRDRKVLVCEEGDLLQQEAAIRTLVAAIEGLPTPACMALYGRWGSGKTNILHNAQARVADDLHVPVWFDPWQYDQQPDLMGPLIRSLLDVARSHRGDPERWEAYKGKARRFWRASKAVIGRVAARKALNAVAADPMALDVFHDDASPAESEARACLPNEEVDASDESGAVDETVRVQDMGALERWLDDEKAPQDAVTAVKRRFADLVGATLKLAARGGEPKPDRRIVFFLDDLDRCLPDRVVELIEQVKLLLCGSDDCRAIFVFALDRRIVGEAIRHRFPGASQYSGENYLEKIFDFSMETPPLPAGRVEVRAFVEHCAGGADALDDLCDPFGNAEPLLDALSIAPLANPRVIKRALNRLRLLMKVIPREREADLRRIGDADRYVRCLLWLAGMERYRPVRYYLRSSSHDEAKDLVTLVEKAGDPSGLSGDALAISRLPGIQVYFTALNLLDRLDSISVRRDQAFRAWSDSSHTPVVGSLPWFDDLLRAAGL